MSILDPRAIFYDKVINIRLEKTHSENFTTSAGNSTVSSVATINDFIEIGSWYDSDSIASQAANLLTNHMTLKPNIRVSMDLLQGNNAFGIRVVITNLAHITDITDYTSMSIQMGYMMASKTNPTASNLRTFDSVIFTSYQTSPNPDGETVFDGVIVGKWYDLVSNNPVNFKFYPITVPVRDEDGNQVVDDNGKKITKKECLIKLSDFIQMIANCKSDDVKYIATDKRQAKGKYNKDTLTFEETKEESLGTVESVETTSAQPIVVKYCLDPVDENKFPKDKYPELYDSGEPYDYVIDIYSMETGVESNFISLVKAASDVIKDQMESRYGITTHLIIFNNELILIGAGHFESGKDSSDIVDIGHVYSCSFSGPLLNLEAPYNPNVVPGGLIRVCPEYWNGADVNNLMGEVRELAKQTGTDGPKYIYSIITMHIDFGTYEGNTMQILAVPISLTEADADKITSDGQGRLNQRKEEVKAEYLVDDSIRRYFIYGDPAAKDNDVTNIQSHTGISKFGNSTFYYQVGLGDTILSIARLKMGWNKLVWRPYNDDNQAMPKNFVTKVYSNSLLMAAYKKAEKRPDIPFSALWPLIILSTKQFYNDSNSNLPLGMTISDADYDSVNTPIATILNGFLWLPIDMNESNVQELVGDATVIDMFEKCASWAWKMWRTGNDQFTAENVKDLINAALFFGADRNNIKSGD